MSCASVVRSSSVVLLLLSAATPSTLAAWPSDPTVNLPICTAVGAQGAPAVAPDGTGGTIIAWEDERNGSGNSDIYAQRVSVTGVTLWAPNGVPLCAAGENQHFPTIVSDGAGGAIVAWMDFRSGITSDIFVQRVSAAGVPQWHADGVALCLKPNSQYDPMIISDNAGGAIVTWADNSDVYAQRVNAAGVPQWTLDGMPLCTADGQQDHPTIVSDGAGGAIVTWEDARASAGFDIYAQRVSAAGTVQWSANGIPVCAAGGSQTVPTIASDGAEGAIMVWNDYRSGGTSDLYTQRVNATGIPQWAVGGVPLSTQPGDQAFGMVTTDGAGGAIVAWHDYRSGGADIYAQRVSAAGTPQWTVDGVPVSTASNDQIFPIIESDGLGGAFIAWTDKRSGSGNADIYVQHLDAVGEPQLAPEGAAVSTAPGNQYASTIFPIAPIALDGTGAAIIAWSDQRGGDFDVYAQRVPLDAPVPVLVSVVSTDASASEAQIVWSVAGGPAAGFVVERRTEWTSWQALANVLPDGGGVVAFEDHDVRPGTRYGYRLREGADGRVSAQSEVWVDTPPRARFALLGARPNPTLGGLALSFSLPDVAPARIEMFDVSGRRVLVHDLVSQPPGDQTLSLDETLRLGPGLYLIRLTQGNHTAVARIALVR